jgi:integrase
MTFTYQGKQYKRSTGTRDRKLAETILGKVRTKIIEGRFFDTLEEKERTFAEMMQRYQAEHARKKARCHASFIRSLLLFFGRFTLAEITPKLIVQYKAKRYADGVGPGSINRELGVMRHAFNLAIKEWEWCRDNPVRRISMEKERARDRWLTLVEEARLYGAMPAWLKDIVCVALHTGLRRGEILALSWEAVDLFRRTVTVLHSKNGEPRTIPMNQTVVDLLKEHSKVRPLKGNYVFYGETPRQAAAWGLERAFRRAVREAGIENLRFHDLRHTFATRLVQAGVDLYKVQRLLGHKSPDMTQRYAHHSTESLREGVEILDQNIKKDETFRTILGQSLGGLT